jgi:sulfate transport system ATP-binding protein
VSIDIRQVSKRFSPFGKSSGTNAVDDVSLTIETGELVALLGPSGSGKTTLLRMIAGLEAPDTGEIWLKGRAGSDKVNERNVGFVFQHYALFKHMTVFENVAFGLRVKPKRERPPEADIARRVNELLGLVQLDGLADRYPNQLSGGQRQRVALARALAIEPAVLLLDEPFGALDARVRRELRAWLRRLHDELNITCVLVTHDQEEALEVADRVVVMNHGRIEQAGSPADVYDHPATPFVAEFIGDVNVLPLPGEGRPIWVRPHEIDVSTFARPKALEGTIVNVHAAGPVARLHVALPNHALPVQVVLSRDEAKSKGLQDGTTVWLAAQRVRSFDTGAGATGAGWQIEGDGEGI